MMEAAIAFVFGLLIGSFLNVCIHRWPRGRSVVKPRSHCVRCRKTIAWYDNIPVLSYIVLGGQCRYCKRRISIRYPLVEFSNAALWFWFVYRFGLGLPAVKLCIFASILLALTFCDLEKRLLPDQFTKGGIVLGVVFSLFVPLPGYTAGVLWLLGRAANLDLKLTGWVASLVESLVGAGLPALLLWGGAYIWSKARQRESWEMLGMGDVKLVAMVGAFLGLMGAMVTMLYGAIAGSVLGTLYVLVTKKKFSEYELPFGTFLGVAGLLVAVMWPK
jgi:leader peptidase (prepilin peptidase)/N-methyltransferase